MSRTALPRGVGWLLTWAVPVRTRAQVLADLEDDYAGRRRAGAARVDRWLAREVSSLVVSHGLARLRATRRVPYARWIDCRLAWRAIRRRPIRFLAAAAMLGSGIAATATVAGLADNLLLTPAVAGGGRAAMRVASVDRSAMPRFQFSFAELDALSAQLDPGDRLVAANLQPAAFRVGVHSVQGLGEVVTPGFFAMTRPALLAGRTLLDTDHRPSAPPVAVIGADFWRSQFGSAPSAVGMPLRVNATSVTIVGVIETRGALGFGGVAVDVWMPSAHADAMLNPGWRTDPADRWWVPLLDSATGPVAAETRLARARDALIALAPDQWRDRRIVLQRAWLLAGSQRRAAGAILAMVGALALVMLLVSAASVGGLLLAAAAAERQHLAVHLALGAGRAGLVSRRALEGGLIGAAGGIVAVALYAWARIQLANVALQPGVVLRLELPLGVAVVVAMMAFGTAVGVVLALGPALWALRFAWHDAVGRAGARLASGMPRARQTLVGVQVALSVVLVMAAAVAIRSLDHLTRVDPGFDREGLIAMDFDVEPLTSGAVEAAALARQALERVRGLASVRGATMANRAPVDPSTPTSGIRRPGTAAAEATATLSAVGDAYFTTVGIPLVAGRDFRDEEVRTNADVAVVNQVLARTLWPDGDAIGRALVIDRPLRTVRIVGISRDARSQGLAEPLRPQVYVPVAPAFSLALLARASGDGRQALRDAQAALDEVGPGVVGFFPRTMDEHLSFELLPSRAAARAAVPLGAVALALSVAGLFGFASWFVEVRRREIGVRLALGAAPGQVRRMVIRQVVRATVPGAVAGVAVGIGLIAAARTVLAGVSPIEPVALAGAIVTIVLLVGAASYVPSRRAAGVDPVECLRDW